MENNFLIIGGWTSQKIYFEGLIKELTGKNILYIDFNDSENEEDLKAKLKKSFSSFNNKVDVIAWSLGGLVMIDNYLNHKNQINTLTLISSMSKFSRSKDFKIGWNDRIISRMQDKLTNDMSNVIESFTTTMSGNLNCNFFINTFQSKDISALNFGLEYLKTKDSRHLLKHIDCPVLIIHGANDTISSLEQSKYIFDNLNSKKHIYIFDDEYHMPFYNNAKKCADEILKFSKGGEL